jgi:predicted DNA-binding transcriptional regulator AlpA
MTGPQQTYLPSSAVRARYGVSDMTIWRWLHNNKLRFPAPMRINSRRFWKLRDLEAWEASRSAVKPSAEKRTPSNGNRHGNRDHRQTDFAT